MEKSKQLELTHVRCCVCETDDAAPVGIGEDFEHRTCSDTFLAMRCNSCGLIYLNPRPSVSEFETIYPSNYHAYDFSEKDFGFVHKVRSRLEARRLLQVCRDLPDDARILDVGCADGFHLKLLRKYGKKTWKTEGVDVSERAVEAARKSGLEVHHGNIEELDLPKNAYDLVFMIQTIEHVAQPEKVISAVREVLKPGGKFVVVTDNTDSIDFKFFKASFWGGYDFPRHLNLFNRDSLTKLAKNTGFEIAKLTTAVSPVNWVYSIHNSLVAFNAPNILVDRFTLRSTVSLSVFTSLDIALQKFGRGALLKAILRKPTSEKPE